MSGGVRLPRLSCFVPAAVLFIGTAAASELFPEGEGLRTAPELSVSATAQPILRILYAADSHGALHPCPS